MGSEFYAYFAVESDKVDSSSELDEIARAKAAPPISGPTTVAPRSSPGSPRRAGSRQGQDLEMWFNSEHLHLFD